ncbi:MAG: DUF3369 domain-containing protein [Magnetococcales bacterium]|nr:DUF3369 domain-containing protein [Magnetococcales bacterium]
MKEDLHERINSEVVPERCGLWKIMIIDDDPGVHRVTQMVLAKFRFEGLGLQFVNGYSGADAKRLIQEHPDTAIILLDVVMVTDNAGLEVVKYIRQDVKNRLVRIILRTGQPGQAPELEVTEKYDINDYKEKTSLSSTALATSLFSSLRAFRDMRSLDKTRIGLQKIIHATGNLFEFRSLNELATGILTQLAILLNVGNPSNGREVECFAANDEQGFLTIYAAFGKYETSLGLPVKEMVTPELWSLIDQAISENKSQYVNSHYIGLFKTKKRLKNIIYLLCHDQIQPQDRELLDLFSLSISASLENLLLNREIIDTQKSVTFTLGEVIEARSGETGHHVRRVAEGSRVLASLIGLSQEEVELIWLASPLHDLGKIGISDAILNKPGKLNQEEWAKIQDHPRLGCKILQGQDKEVIKAGRFICSQHHEKWDGSGYPEGLAGEEIHIFARITAVIDVFDSLYHKRSYKEPWPLEKIIALFKEERGKHFEPRLIDIFLDNLNIFLGIQKSYGSV